MQFVDLQAQRTRLGSKIDEAIARVLDHGVFIHGPEVAEFERQLADLVGARHCISCGNGTDALVLALRALDLQQGQGVIVPSFTFAATAEAVVLAGGVPVFADIDATTFNLDSESVALARKEAEAGGIDVVGAIAVDLFGQPANYDALTDSLSGLWLIADAAQSLGASVGPRRVGSLAPITTTSFFPAKPLGCYGDGGALFADDDDTAAILRSLRVHGQGSDKYDNVRVGTNSRLDTIQAAILLVKLAAFPEELLQRQRVADSYRQHFAGSPISTPTILEGFRSSWAQYTVRIPNRDAAAAALQRQGIPSAVYYRQPLHNSSAYARFASSLELSATVEASHDVLSLPMFPDLGDDDIAVVANALLACVNESTP
jgi:dTDP-4-amino-4,6-dideoxygalactose transaminase